MRGFYDISVRYLQDVGRTRKDGTPIYKKISELYLVEASSVSDAVDLINTRVFKDGDAEGIKDLKIVYARTSDITFLVGKPTVTNLYKITYDVSYENADLERFDNKFACLLSASSLKDAVLQDVDASLLIPQDSTLLEYSQIQVTMPKYKLIIQL